VTRDAFGGTLAAWRIDANATGASTSWAIVSGRLDGHSAGAGTDAVVDTFRGTDMAAVALMRVSPLTGVSGYRAAGPIVRATSIDFADNLFYFCMVDPPSGVAVLARYDVETRVGSGQRFTELGRAPMPSDLSGFVTVTLCARGMTITCEIPAIGVRITGTDARYADGQAGMRVMQADVEVEWFEIWAP